MKSVQVKLFKIKVAKFIPKDGSVELSITYGNKSIKEILKTERIVYPTSLARRIIAEVKKTVKSAHHRFEDRELLDTIKVNVKNEKDLVKKIAHFLQQLRIKVERVRNMKIAEGYIDAVREVDRMVLQLE